MRTMRPSLAAWCWGRSARDAATCTTVQGPMCSVISGEFRVLKEITLRLMVGGGGTGGRI